MIKFATSIEMPRNKDCPLYLPFVEEQKGVFLVRDFATFIQLIGKLKYVAAEDDLHDRRVFFRGQPDLYGKRFSPSAYRQSTKAVRQGEIDKSVEALIDRLRKSVSDMNKLAVPVVEGVFQQYGLKSRWIDAVDNIWIALWFACHRCWSSENGDLHYERRDARKECGEDHYAYILALEVDLKGVSCKGNRGYCQGERCEFLDLRRALPSYYIRPHVQHGVLIREVSGHGKPKMDQSGLIQCVIKIPLEVALSWLGNGVSFAVGSIFPTPHFDTGLQRLLNAESETFLGRMNYDNSPVHYSRVWA